MMSRFATLFLALFLFSLNADAYRFLCNGVEADGSEMADHCGECTEESAPRWTPSSVDVLVDLKTRPKGLSETDWKNAFQGSLAAWNQVQGGNLDLRHAGDSTERRFGSDASKHEVFWVLSKEEWRQKVGSGENATLGVTVSPYHCPRDGRASREIYDADLIMNGAAKIKWKLECRESGPKCESITATLVHELGHFIGLGHPCTDCEWSIMAAMSGSGAVPVKDDLDAVRVLYPSGLAGHMGMRCEGAADCKVDLQCIPHNETKYCSMACSSSSCPRGYTCDLENGSVCRFATGRLAPPAGLKERCETRPCQADLQCVDTNSNKSVCVQNCLVKADCPKEETCVLFADGGSGICLQSVGLNETCGDLTTCADNLVCVGRNDAEGSCKAECDAKKKRCADGAVCSPVGNDIWACLDKQSDS